MKSVSATSKHQSSPKTTGTALTTPSSKQQAKKSAPTATNGASNSPDSDDSSDSGGSPDKEKTGGEIHIPETTNAVVVSPVKSIIMSEAMVNNYLYYDANGGPPVHKTVSFISKKSKEKMEKFVLSVDLINKDKKFVTIVIWEDTLKTILFFEKWFR
jgi:hypothetical protein